jgi:hypothetical protein
MCSYTGKVCPLAAGLHWEEFVFINLNHTIMAIPVSEVISHWSHFFQSFTISAKDFYTVAEKIIASHNMPHTEVKRVEHKEGGIFSSNREYLRIKHGKLVFDVCAAPFGTDFFISWWLYETEGTATSLLKNTAVGGFLKAREKARTFYQADEEAMFRSCVHECILEAVAAVTEGKIERKLTTEEKAIKPQLELA